MLRDIRGPGIVLPLVFEHHSPLADKAVMDTPLQYFSTRRLSEWQGEVEFLQQSLTREPEAAQAWWWKLRLKVLTFVIRHYGADPVVRARDYAPALRETSGDLMHGERRTVEPRPHAALGVHLQSIAKENDFPRPPAPRDEDDGILDRWIAVHQQQWRCGVKFLYGAFFGFVFSGSVAISAGVRDGVEVCLYAGLGWLFSGVLVAFFGELLFERFVRWITKH
jgi:hypothetical protein